MSKLTKSAFQKLISENIAWLLTQERTLERDHIVGILNDCVDFYYPSKKKDL